jgi:NtrC-family two-component system response regulator AlgB
MNLLLVGDERKIRRMFAWGFSAEFYRVRMASTRRDVEALMATESFHAACLDWKMCDASADELTALLQQRLPTLPIVALVGERDPELEPSGDRRGVVAQLITPCPIDELHATIRRHALTLAVTAAHVPAAPLAPRIVEPALLTLAAGDDVARRTLNLALRAAKSTAAILIQGETGTGKSRLAQTIHAHSPNSHQPFVTVNCPCLNHELLESELFGHVRGSFTGAIQDTWGKVAAANGGTLFLDEIGDLPMSLQPKLLRLLQEKQYERVGETTSRSANVRIIAATNRNLKTEVLAGRFREDLYYRLNVIAIDVPALRGRPWQIMRAVESFLESISAALGRPAPSISAETRRSLENYRWPGNLRELRNVVERAAILAGGPQLEPEDFPSLLSEAPETRYQIGGAISLAALESAHIQMVVANSASLEEAARILEIDKSTLYRKRKQIASSVAPFPLPAERTVAVAAAG